MKVLSVGSLNIDRVYHVDRFVMPGETKKVAGFQVNCGGKGLNQSIAMARAGFEVHHAGCISEDGLFLKQELERYGVHTECIELTETATGHAIIQVDEQGENCILLSPGANAVLTEEMIGQWISCFEKGDILLVQNETNMIPGIMEAAFHHGLQIAFNAAPFTEEIRTYPLSYVKWLFVNEIEGGQIADETEPERILKVLNEAYPEMTVVLTLGEKGAIISGPGVYYSCPAWKTAVLDTTAAGDTFVGYFLYGSLLGTSEYAMNLATAASSITISRKGAAGSIPSMNEVLLKMTGSLEQGKLSDRPERGIRTSPALQAGR